MSKGRIDMKDPIGSNGGRDEAPRVLEISENCLVGSPFAGSTFTLPISDLTPRFFNSGNTRPAYLPVAPTIRTLIYCSQDINERVLQECMRIQTTVLTRKQINDQRMLSDFGSFP